MSSCRSLGQHRLLGLQIFLQRFNGGRLGPHSPYAWLLHHLVINEPLADVPDLNVAAIGFPELAFFQCR